MRYSSAAAVKIASNNSASQTYLLLSFRTKRFVNSLPQFLLLFCLWMITFCTLVESAPLSSQGAGYQRELVRTVADYRLRIMQVNKLPPKQANCPGDMFYNESAEACVKCHPSCTSCAVASY